MSPQYAEIWFESPSMKFTEHADKVLAHIFTGKPLFSHVKFKVLWDMVKPGINQSPNIP